MLVRKTKITNLLHFGREQIFMAGATIIEVAEMVAISRGTFSKMLKAYEKEGKHLPVNRFF